MGIKGLWGVFTPFSEKKSMHEIRGQSLAIDLSGWVCDSQNVTDYCIQPKLYLKNLFFRTVFLLLMDINPIFVLEGEAPKLKSNVMAARNAVQFRGTAPRVDAMGNKNADVTRKRFTNVLKECESLLKCMGVRCIKGRGEAEATCALMNAQNLVDAVVSQDSDCFAYGAQRVYRNFSVSNAAGGGALHGSVDCYDALHMFRANGFGRNKMIALAMLCGCDYGAGACGSSINTVVSYLHTVPEGEIINRLLSWVSDPQLYEEQARWASQGRCERCGHEGRTHARRGCAACASINGCTDNGHKSKVSAVKRELSLRSRALSSGTLFPDPNVMKEFLNVESDQIDIASLKQPAPSLIQFVKLMARKLDWTERYSVSKFLPLLTKWHLRDNVPSRTIKPVTIKKKRNPRGVPSYEVIWTDIDGVYEALIPDEQLEENEDINVVWTTTERQDLMRLYYPEVVDIYEESVKKPVKEKRTKSRKKNEVNTDKPKRKYTKKPKNIDINSLSVSLRNISLKENLSVLNKSKGNVSIKVNKLKRKIKVNIKGKGQKTMDSYLKNKRRKSDKALIKSLCRSSSNISIMNKVNQLAEDINSDKENLASGKPGDVTADAGDIDECDLSEIVDRIIRREPDVKTARIDNNLVKLVYNNVTPRKCFRRSILSQNNSSTPKESPRNRRVSLNSSYSKVNTSYFFDKLTEEGDAFEVSVDSKHRSAKMDCDDTIDYSLPQVCL